MTAKDLKNALLQEAVQGKLVPQIASEGNAKDLLEEIKKEKAKLIKEGKLKKEKPLPEIGEDEIPFEIPENWCWCRLGEVVPFGSCQNAAPKDIKDEDWILDLEDIEKDTGKILIFKLKKEVKAKSTKHIFKKDFVLYSKLRPYLNKCVVAPKDGFCTSEILPLDFGKNIHNKYAQIYLMSPFFVGYTNALSFGVKMPRLGTEDGKKALFPLPPLAEQKRIVAALEKFMPLVEDYGKKESELRVLNNSIPKQLKNAILQEAVQGKLTEGWRKSTDVSHSLNMTNCTTCHSEAQSAEESQETGKQLLDRIIEERKKMAHGLDFANAKSGKRKSKKETALAGSNPCDIPEDQIPFEIPESWCWCRLGDLAFIARGGSPRPITEYLTNDSDGYNWIKISDTDKGGKYINSTKQRIKKEGLYKTRLIRKGDFLLTNSMSFGRPYISNIEGCIHDGWLVFSFPNNCIISDFIYYLLSSSFIYKQFADSAAGAVVQNLNTDKVIETIIPLPPLPEQKKIVEIIEQMLPLCEKLGG